MNRQDWLAKLDAKNDKGTMTYAENHQELIDTAKAKFMSEVKAGRFPKIMHGAFGPETKDSDAYIEEEVLDNGHAYKLYGCSYLYKGTFDDSLVHALQMPKAVISGILSRMMRLPAVALGWAFTYLFQRKKFIAFANALFDDIEWRVMRHYDIKENEYNAYAREIKRAAELACDDSPWGILVKKVIRFIVLIFETDNAYRLRVQDALEASLRVSPAFTIFDVLKVLESREVKGKGIAGKWRFVRFALRFLLLTSPKLAKIIQRTLIHIDINKVKLDEDDWYFTLRFLSYNFKGLTAEERLQERDRLDKLTGTIYFI